jgi:hypothetical protein
MSGTEWSDQENDLIVADYFDMLGAELRGEKRSKARHRRALVSLLNQRTEGSVEFKHQNISAVLLGLGQPWIVGYKPASQFQLSLVDAVMRLLESRSDWLLPQRNRPEGSEGREKGWGESGVPLWIGPPPTVSNAPPPIDPERMAFIARKAAGRNDLAAKVRWTAQDDGDGLGFDIQSFEPNGRPRLIEVKTTNGWERTPFHITRTELAAAEAHRDQWHLIRIWNFAREPRAFGIRPPLGQHIELTPTSFLAAIR